MIMAEATAAAGRTDGTMRQISECWISLLYCLSSFSPNPYRLDASMHSSSM